MKRIIKFRAWDSKYQKMYYSHGDNPRVNCFHGDWEIDLESENGDTIGTVGCDEKTYPLMQYTGLLDKNGKEIWEGDIIEFNRNEWGGDDNIHIVSWDEEEGAWSWGGGTTSDMEWRTVIGNIHENPELIK
jgi:uncharacterized phage protein (TIGR01671 family)